ncbi:MAG: histidine kinase [Ignavibacteriales bacterium]|nr:histidine kinase [Ignavibacteriales bacterium]
MRKSISIIIQIVLWFLHVVFFFGYLSTIGAAGQYPASIFKILLELIFVLLTLAIPFYGSLIISKQIIIRKNKVRAIWIAVFISFLTLYTILFPKSVIDLYNGSLSSLGDNYESLNNYINHFISISLVGIYAAFGFLFSFFSEWNKNKAVQELLEKQNIKSELELLKSQINPHFLFNTLNNIDILILDEPRKASDYLKKLSGILRYVLYETSNEKVHLSSEVAYIQKYVELQKIRTTNNKFASVEIIGNINDVFIAPMILIHFVENAFKFATNKKIENGITIRLEVLETEVVFNCKNHIDEDNSNSETDSGLGFKLIKQRLDIIYRENYVLKVSEENNWYIVDLKIKF